MARVTVEGCLENIENRFELVLTAAKRARELIQGGTPKVDRHNDRSPVVALREIEAGHISRSMMDELVTSPDINFEEEFRQIAAEKPEIQPGFSDGDEDEEPLLDGEPRKAVRKNTAADAVKDEPKIQDDTAAQPQEAASGQSDVPAEESATATE